VLEEMANGSTRIIQNDIGKKMFKGMWDRMHPDYRGQLKQKIQQVMDQASRGQFSKHLQRNTTARAVTQSLSWDVLDNPHNGAMDKRQKGWRGMLRKQRAFIDYLQDPNKAGIACAGWGTSGLVLQQVNPVVPTSGARKEFLSGGGEFREPGLAGQWFSGRARQTLS
jgi:hypothetical protein